MKPIPRKTQADQKTDDFLIFHTLSIRSESFMEKLGILELTGHSNQIYTFHTYSLKQPLSVISTIYVVCRAHQLAQGHIEYDKLFIGSTENLTVTFNPHTHRAAFARFGANAIGIYPISNPQNRKIIELDLIEQYQPICNQ